MYRYIVYLKFLITSTNQHGVHSPFVYQFITKGLYTQKKNTSKTIDVLLKSIDYLKAISLKISPNNVNIATIVQDNYPAILIQKSKGDIHYYDNPNSFEHINSALEGLDNDTMLLIRGIHKNLQSTRLWNQLKEHSKVTVSMDLFHCGAIFIRKEQAKEHFKIRI